jgi:hypothetical protein
MFALKGKNAIIIGPHPRAKKCNWVVVNMMRDELAKLGAPVDLIQTMEEPSVELSSMLMKSADVVVATGGMPMVKSAYSSGKPSYGVGPGNVQGLVDEDVDFNEAAQKMIASRTFDNGIICSGDQTIIAPATKYNEVIDAFKANCAFYVDDPAMVDQFRDAIFDGLTLPAIAGSDLWIVLFQCAGHEFGREFAVIFPIVQTVVVGQGHIHIGGVADVCIIHPGPLFDRVEDAGTGAAFFLRLVQTHQKQGEKGHIIAQTQPGDLAGRTPDTAAKSAIHGLIALPLRF